MKEFRIPSKESCMQSETEALIEQDLDPPSPAAQSSTKRCSLLTDRLDPGIAFPRGSLPRSCSRDSVRSLRRASSLDDIDGMRAEWNSRPGDPRINSSECLRVYFHKTCKSNLYSNNINIYWIDRSMKLMFLHHYVNSIELDLNFSLQRKS